jgi:hypothetical protein
VQGIGHTIMFRVGIRIEQTRSFPLRGNRTERDLAQDPAVARPPQPRAAVTRATQPGPAVAGAMRGAGRTVVIRAVIRVKLSRTFPLRGNRTDGGLAAQHCSCSAKVPPRRSPNTCLTRPLCLLPCRRFTGLLPHKSLRRAGAAT